MLKRHNFSVETNVLVGYSKKLMTYSEESFDVLEQLACLGIVKDGVDWNGQPIKVLHPIDVSTIPRSLFTERSWSGDDISTLKDLVEVPSIIASDDPYVFQVTFDFFLFFLILFIYLSIYLFIDIRE